jgi:hypothetical protein
VREGVATKGAAPVRSWQPTTTRWAEEKEEEGVFKNFYLGPPPLATTPAAANPAPPAANPALAAAPPPRSVHHGRNLLAVGSFSSNYIKRQPR